MAVRTTQSYVTTLDIGDGDVRVTQVYTTVLTRDIEIVLPLSNSLSLSDNAGIPTFAGVENDFGFLQSLEHNYVVLDITNSLGLSADIGLDYTEDIIQYLGWTPRTIVECSNSMFSEDNEAGVFVVRVIVDSLSNTFGFEDGIIQAHNATNSLSFEEIVTHLQQFDVFNQFTLVAAVDSSPTEYGRGMEQGCLKQHITYTISGNRCIEKDYRPFVGEGGDPAYESINTTPPTLSNGTLTLTYPFVAPTTTLVLKNPSLGNTSTFTRSAVHRKTRGGDDVIAADQSWPTTEVQNLVIENICETDIDAVVDFLNASLGLKIGLLDWESRQWSGVVLAPETEIIQTGINSWKFTLVFDGELE